MHLISYLFLLKCMLGTFMWFFEFFKYFYNELTEKYVTYISPYDVENLTENFDKLL